MQGTFSNKKGKVIKHLRALNLAVPALFATLVVSIGDIVFIDQGRIRVKLPERCNAKKNLQQPLNIRIISLRRRLRFTFWCVVSEII